MISVEPEVVSAKPEGRKGKSKKSEIDSSAEPEGTKGKTKKSEIGSSTTMKRNTGGKIKSLKDAGKKSKSRNSETNDK